MADSPRLELRWLGDIHAAMRLERAVGHKGKHRPLARIFAAADASLWVEVEFDGGSTQFPLAELKNAIAAAESDVHPEGWRDLRDVLGDEGA